MTSTIFSSKTFPTFYKWSFRRNRPVMIIFSVLTALAIILGFYAISLVTPMDGVTKESMIEGYGDIGNVVLIVLQVGAIFFTFVSALLTFSFLHNKRSTDMFGSVPSTRGTVYIAHLLGGISAVAAPYLAGSLIMAAVTSRSTEYLLKNGAIIVTGLISIAAAYVFTSLIAYCCGTVIDTAIISLAANAIYTGTIALFWGAASEMIPGLDFENVIYSPILPAFSPYTFCFFNDFYMFDGEKTAFWSLFVWSIIFAAGIFALALYAAIRRKAEIAQSDFSVKWLPLAVKAGASVVAGGLVGCIAALSSSNGVGNMVIFCFWYVIIGFAAFFILHIIFSRGLKGKFLPSFITYAATTVVVIGIMCALSTGLGIDTYVPDASNVKSVYYAWDEYKDPENIKNITELHKVITEGLHQAEEYPYYLGSTSYIYDYDYTYDGGYYNEDGEYVVDKGTKADTLRSKYPLVYSSSYNFEYSKKVGFKTIRSYYIGSIKHSGGVEAYDYAKMEELLEKIYNSEEYKRFANDNEMIFDDQKRADYIPNDNSQISCYSFGYDPNVTSTGINSKYSIAGTVSMPTGATFTEGLIQALKKDILADNEYYKTKMIYVDNGEKVFGDSYLSLSISYRKKDPRTHNEDYWSNYEVSVFVPSTYKNTIDYLEAHGVSTKLEDYAKGNVGSDSIDPLDFVRTSDLAYDDYYPSFAMSGSQTDLMLLVDELTETYTYAGIFRSGIEDDPYDWYAEHKTEMTAKLEDRARELYTEWKDSKPSVAGYYNQYMADFGYEAGDGYFYLADEILRDLDKYSVKAVNEINSGITADDKTKDDAESASDTDNGRESDTDKAASDADKNASSKAADTDKTPELTTSVIDA